MFLVVTWSYVSQAQNEGKKHSENKRSANLANHFLQSSFNLDINTLKSNYMMKLWVLKQISAQASQTTAQIKDIFNKVLL